MRLTDGLAAAFLIAGVAFGPAPLHADPAVPAPRRLAQAAEPPATPPAATPTPPAAAPAPPASGPAQAAPADPFGEELQVTARTVVFIKGTATWDSAYDTLVDSFKSVYGLLEKLGIPPSGPAMTIYIETDDTGFQYRAAVPIASAPADPPKGDIEVGQSPAGRMLKFVHRGSYDALYTTYDSITEYFDSRQLEAQDTFIEEYETNPVTTAEDKLVINVLVPVK